LLAGADEAGAEEAEADKEEEEEEEEEEDEDMLIDRRLSKRDARDTRRRNSRRLK